MNENLSSSFKGNVTYFNVYFVYFLKKEIYGKNFKGLKRETSAFVCIFLYDINFNTAAIVISAALADVQNLMSPSCLPLWMVREFCIASVRLFCTVRV